MAGLRIGNSSIALIVCAGALTVLVCMGIRQSFGLFL